MNNTKRTDLRATVIELTRRCERASSFEFCDGDLTLSKTEDGRWAFSSSWGLRHPTATFPSLEDAWEQAEAMEAEYGYLLPPLEVLRRCEETIQRKGWVLNTSGRSREYSPPGVHGLSLVLHDVSPNDGQRSLRDEANRVLAVMRLLGWISDVDLAPRPKGQKGPS